MPRHPSTHEIGQTPSTPDFLSGYQDADGYDLRNPASFPATLTTLARLLARQAAAEWLTTAIPDSPATPTITPGKDSYDA